jgi:hypothetical protein
MGKKLAFHAKKLHSFATTRELADSAIIDSAIIAL